MVHAIDDDAAFLQAVSRFLRASGLQVKTFCSAAEFLKELAHDTTGCVLADLHMPHINGLELQTVLIHHQHSLPIVFLTGAGDIPSTVQAMRHGAVDFLEKMAPKEKLLNAVQRALASDISQREARTRQHKLQVLFNLLTSREKEVLSHVVRGELNKQIGAQLGICERTVKVHRLAITSKLGVPSVAELTRMTIEAGFFRT
ncbi:MAG: response regulator transcription factor [Candidatus Methylacidiphilales bacterium]|nr:response regulator [Candidatus Methylacidiphilales bacterium]